MVEIQPARSARARQWEDDFPGRLASAWEPVGAAGAASVRASGWRRATRREFAVIADGADGVGYLTLAYYQGALFGVFDGTAIFFDLWVDPAHRGRGYGRAARAYGEAWARAAGARSAAAAIWAGDPGLAALFAGYPLRNQRMGKALGDGQPPDCGFRPMRPGAEFDGWLARGLANFAADLAGSGSTLPGPAEAEAERTYATYLPRGLDTADNSIWVIEADGQGVADVWLRHGYEPDLSFILDIAVYPEFRGRGYGRAAMLVAEDRARTAGDHFIGLNVFGHNHVAINLYDSLGYRAIDSIRSIDL
jgi:GNAT superfamily N-acetyltransferase